MAAMLSRPWLHLIGFVIISHFKTPIPLLFISNPDLLCYGILSRFIIVWCTVDGLNENALDVLARHTVIRNWRRIRENSRDISSLKVTMTDKQDHQRAFVSCQGTEFISHCYMWPIMSRNVRHVLLIGNGQKNLIHTQPRSRLIY